MSGCSWQCEKLELDAAMQAGSPARPSAVFLDCYDSRGRVPDELTEPRFLTTCLQVRNISNGAVCMGSTG